MTAVDQLSCITPPTLLPYEKPGHHVTFDLIISKTGQNFTTRVWPNLFQPLYYYRQPEVQISLARPLSGPEFGGTTVSLQSKKPFVNSRYLECRFGTITVPIKLVDAHNATCTSPAIGGFTGIEPPATVAMNVLFSRSVLANTTNNFHYYLTPSVSNVVPPFGTTEGGTIVQLEGSHFIDDPNLTCKFGDVMVPALRFINENLIFQDLKIAFV